MKKPGSLLPALVMVFAFAGCQKNEEKPGDYMALCERYGVSYGENESEQPVRALAGSSPPDCCI